MHMDAFHLFTLVGIPVRVTLGFMLLVGYYAYMQRHDGIAGIMAWLVAVVVSFLVHEFGHALVARRYKLTPEVYLHGWGGMCTHRPAKRDRDDAFIIAAGPFAGLALAGVVALVANVWPVTIARSPFLSSFIADMWFINFWWSLVNLLPLFPLDGGQLFRLGLLRVVKPARNAERIVHITAIALCAAALVWAISVRSILVGLISAMLLFENIRHLSQGSPNPVRTRNALADQLLTEASRLLTAGDAHEARRLAYQARDERALAPDQVQRAFEMLAVASAALEDWGEALDWAKRANRSGAIDEIIAMSLAGLGRIDEAKQAAREANLGDDVRARIARRTKQSI